MIFSVGTETVCPDAADLLIFDADAGAPAAGGCGPGRAPGW